MTFRLKIAGRYWKVHLVDLGDSLDGDCSPRSREIRINPNQPPKELASTFLHEVLHGLAPGLTERRVRTIEQGLIDLLWRDGWRPSVLLRHGRRNRRR